MPTSVIEAMGLGLPVVCSNVGAIPDFFVNEKMGFMIDDNSPLKFAEKLSILIEDEQRRKEISLFNQNFVESRFIASASVSKIDELYLSI
jgi:glycosyltransferase involved in cell wall biosynthesis